MQLYLSATDCDWEVVEHSDNWSGKIELSYAHEEFLHLPGYGDIKITTEKVGPTAHIFVEEVSKIEFSAKDIRSRLASPRPSIQPPIPSASTPTSPSDTSFATVVEESFDSEQSFVSVVSPDQMVNLKTSRPSIGDNPVTRYHSIIEEEPEERRTEVTVNVFMEELSLAFK